MEMPIEKITKGLLTVESKLFGLKGMEIKTPIESYARRGMRILTYGVLGFLIWAALFPLDKGAPAMGVVLNEANHKVVQHLTGGMVDEILVKDGDKVEAGQLLVRINPISAKGQFNAMRASITGLEAQNYEKKASIKSKKEQYHILEQQLVGLNSLDKEGYIPHNKVLDLQREELRLIDAMQSDKEQFERNLGQILELKQRLTVLNFDLDNTELKAPVSGTVVNSAIFTKGGVISPGMKLMEIVPSDDPLVIDAQLPTQLVDKVYRDLEVELMFTAFNQNRTPKVMGSITNISADRIIDEKTGLSYYKLRIKVTSEGVEKLAKFHIRAGMPVEVFIKTGQRTLLSYIFKPFFDRMHTALREE